MTRASLCSVLPLVFSLSASGDTVELKSGERIEGAFRQAVASGVVIETAGQAITIPLDKVQAIYFGAARPRADTGPSPAQDALDALRGLRSVTGSGISLRDYAPRVLDVRVKVDRYLSASGDAALDATAAIRSAMEAYELASRAFPGREDSSIGENVDPGLLGRCPVIRKVFDSVKLASAMRHLGIDDTRGAGLVDGREPCAVLWSCASTQLAEAERLVAQH